MKLRHLLQNSALAMCLLTAPNFSAHAQTNWWSFDKDQSEEADDDVELEPFRSWRDIDPFRSWRDIDPFRSWRDIEAFRSWRDIEAFRSWRDIEAFRSWRDIEAFRSWRDIEAFRSWRDIEAFGDGLNNLNGSLSDEWLTLAAMEDTSAMAGALETIISESEAFWGDAVTEQTGLSFSNGFADQLLEEYGIDLSDPSSLADLTVADLVYFQFAWNDGLMGFTGTDHVDWWMPMTNWSPDITTVQGGGADTIIGLIDFTVTADEDLQDNLIQWDGADVPAGGHGGAVASLMVADHDGRGVMGIAPGASVAAYNPFNEDGVASFDSVRDGIIQVTDAGASVVNMSLGVSGYTFDAGWVDLYSHEKIRAEASETVFVHAAGNDGLAQTENIAWDSYAQDAANFLIVGSIGIDGQISEFSNTPGDACFTSNGRCVDTLANHFLVAPGEWILVTDGDGGVTRANGTSFAAPIVSGAIALMHDRWPWLTQHPEETVEILLTTATDLGDEGVDDVYGHGLLNIEASQSPINFNDTFLFTEHTNGKLIKYKPSDLTSSKAKKNMWNTEEGYFVVFEDIGNTQRDFLVPMNQMLVGTYADVDGIDEMFQHYLYDGFVDWAASTNFASANLATSTDLDIQVSYAPLAFGEDKDARLPYRTELMAVTPGGAAIRIGQGDGGSRLGFGQGTAAGSSNPLTGGTNPVLGLASGGIYANADMPLTDTMRLSFGATERYVHHSYDDINSGEEIALYDDLTSYQSHALSIGLSNQLTERLSMQTSYTALTEQNGLLGMQSLLPGGFGEGSTTDAATFGLNYQATNTVSLTASATYGQTQTIDEGAALTAENMSTSAYEFALTANQVFSDNDAIRIAVIQPMHIEDGDLSARSVEVVDRSTGELGVVNNSFDLTSGERSLAIETRYGARFNDDKTEISAFARIEGQRGESTLDEMDHMIGGRLALRY